MGKKQLEGPSNASSDILGIEVGRDVVRGVLLNSATSEITAVAECAVISDRRSSADGPMSVPTVAPAVTDLMHRLGIEHGSGIRTAITIGPRHSGVGSGPALPKWLEDQTNWLEQSLIYAGETGIAFAPAKAVQAVLTLAGNVGLDPIRVDLAPVAAARLLGDEVEDAITLGSGRGWRARLRNFEVLEAMEVSEIGDDEPLRIIRRDGLAGPITQYRNARMAEPLNIRHPLDLSQLAPAVGAAVGIRENSPGNLLLGHTIAYTRPMAAVAAGNGVAGSNGVGASNGVVAGDGAGQVGELSDADMAAAFRYDPAHTDMEIRPDGRTDTTELKVTTGISPLARNRQNGDGAHHTNGSSNGNGQVSGNGYGRLEPPLEGAEHHSGVTTYPPVSREPAQPDQAGSAYRDRVHANGQARHHAAVRSANGAASARVADAPDRDQELIDMFRPEDDAVHQIRKAAGSRNFGLTLGIMVVVALALALLYTYL